MNIVDLKKHNTNTENQEVPEQPERRKFLKILLIGAGAFLAGFLTRFLGPASKFFSSSEKSTPAEKQFGDWNIIEKKSQVTFIDKKTNEEVLILDWGTADSDKEK